MDVNSICLNGINNDKAYMTELNLSPSQFIQLRSWDVIEKKEGANIDVLVGSGETPMWNIKQ